MDIKDLTRENGWYPAFLGDAYEGMTIALEYGTLDFSGEKPVTVFHVETGAISTFVRISSIPHDYIAFTLNSAQPRNSRPDRKIWIKKG